MFTPALFFFALPFLYFGSVFTFTAGFPNALAATGVVSLVAAIVTGASRREAGLYWLFLPIALSQLLIVFAKYLSETFDNLTPLLSGFMAVEIGIILFMLSRCKTSRGAGYFGGWFAFTYAVYTLFGFSLVSALVNS